MNIIQTYNLYRDSEGECSKAGNEKNKIVGEVIQLRTELASFKFVHESLKLENDISDVVIRSKDKEIARLWEQLEGSY